ncbi:MAG: alpha-L-rhamnosidase C-terminal domain-containing protein [Deltaproteobacteria bacterium]|nr:alpha-L-rhamnosidase C-terminal domain-containing protein [Deltaproteobacteria bacterium]
MPKLPKAPGSPLRVSRRTLLGGAALVAGVGQSAEAKGAPAVVPIRPNAGPANKVPLTTAPPVPVHANAHASWLWYPSERTLPNTFVLFRRVVKLAAKPRSAPVWVSADSRYLLTVNGVRVHFGPSPCDPRALEADPIDLAPYLEAGENVIGATVLFYGTGDGTWVLGKPGFLMMGNIDGTANGSLDTDDQWLCHLCQSWRPGHAKRSYLRALQEEFDARLHPHGWDRRGFVTDASWHKPMLLDAPPTRPPLTSSYRDEFTDAGAKDLDLRVVQRTIPLLLETPVAATFVEAHRVAWRVPASEYFDFRVPNACTNAGDAHVNVAAGGVSFTADAKFGVALTYVLPEQMVGFPRLQITAPAGTTVEVMIQEAHVPNSVPVMNTHRHSWARFVCREGTNEFTHFDFECCRFIQLHVHGAQGNVKVQGVGLLRRTYPFAQKPIVQVDDPALQKLVQASFNMIANNSQETMVDGMGRERQQYSGDIGHGVIALNGLLGESRLPARFLSTWSQGLTLDGYFLDCWPATDRLNRLAQRQLGITPWGPLLDHGVGFMFDCHNHYMYTGHLDDVMVPTQRLFRFFDYLRAQITPEGLLPVEDLGAPTVWIDHDAFVQQKHKQCAYNLYVVAALSRALAPLAVALGESKRGKDITTFARKLLSATIAKFWDRNAKIFVANLPWAASEGAARLDDRSLATSVLFDLCPRHETQAATKALIEKPKTMGLSYPANVVWNVWALGAAGRADAVVQELRSRWVNLQSVRENNTLSEHWVVHPDTREQWSHAPLAPLLAFPMVFAGIRPTSPGFATAEIAPQLAGLPSLRVGVHTPFGPLELQADGVAGHRGVAVSVPKGVEAVLVVSPHETLSLAKAGAGRYKLPAGATTRVVLSHAG